MPAWSSVHTREKGALACVCAVCISAIEDREGCKCVGRGGEGRVQKCARGCLFKTGRGERDVCNAVVCAVMSKTGQAEEGVGVCMCGQLFISAIEGGH